MLPESVNLTLPEESLISHKKLFGSHSPTNCLRQFTPIFSDF